MFLKRNLIGCLKALLQNTLYIHHIHIYIFLLVCHSLGNKSTKSGHPCAFFNSTFDLPCPLPFLLLFSFLFFSSVCLCVEGSMVISLKHLKINSPFHEVKNK